MFISGFRFELRDVDREELEDHILTANKDNNVDGIIVYYPIFGNRQDQYLQQITDVSKDVEGLSHRYIFNMYQNIRFLDDEQLQKSILVCPTSPDLSTNLQRGRSFIRAIMTNT